MEGSESVLEDPKTQGEWYEYATAANAANLVDAKGVEWLLDMLPEFMINSVEIAKVSELRSGCSDLGKGVEL